MRLHTVVARLNEHVICLTANDMKLQKADQLLMQLSETEILPTKQRLSSKTLAQIIDMSDFDTDGLKKEVFY